MYFVFFFFFKQKTAYEMRISDWSSDVCSSDLPPDGKGVSRQDLHRRTGGRRQLQLQHLPVHGAEHDGEALRRAARSGTADRDRGGPAPQGQEKPRRDARDGQRKRRHGRSRTGESDGGLNLVVIPDSFRKPTIHERRLLGPVGPRNTSGEP